MNFRKHAVIAAVSLFAVIGLSGCATAENSENVSPAPAPISISDEASDLPNQDVLTDLEGGVGANPPVVVSSGGFGELPEEIKAPELPYEGSYGPDDLTVSSGGFGDIGNN
ncbi:hypothetical protein ACWG8W_05995 [Citricoccus zhacaiensis]